MHVGGVIYSLDWYRINMSTARPRDTRPQGVQVLQIIGSKIFENLEGFTWYLPIFSVTKNRVTRGLAVF